ncbi:ribonuclease H1 small subunit, partial [Exidia glandulosa HHB12029]
MSDATLSIKPSGPLPDASPSLMPFHIAHTGPAPLSTYFRVKTTPAGVAEDGTPTRERHVASFRGRTVEGTRVALPEGYVGLVLQSDAQASTLTASSHARRPPSPTKPKKAFTKSKGRKTRSSTVRDEPEPEPEPVEAMPDAMDLDAPLPADEASLDVEIPADAVATRQLTPAGKFDSFLVWGADYAVDEGFDDYIRSLKEWTSLAAEV